MESLFGSPSAKRRALPASLRRLIVDLKAEHPALNLKEIARICFVRTGRKPHLATVRNVLVEEPLPIKAFRRFEPYHEIPEACERRRAVVEHGGDTLSRYDVSFSPGETRLGAVTNPRLLATKYRRPQLKLFALEEALGEDGWLRALRLEGYAARSREKPGVLQGVLFAYLEAP